LLDKYLLYVYFLQELQDGKENAQSNAIFVIGSRRFKFWRPCEEPIDESKPLGCPELRKNRKDLRVFRVLIYFFIASAQITAPNPKRHKSLWLDKVHD